MQIAGQDVRGGDLSYQVEVGDYLEISISTVGTFGLPRLGQIEIEELNLREQITAFTREVCLIIERAQEGVYDVDFLDTAGVRQRLFQLFAVGPTEEG